MTISLHYLPTLMAINILIFPIILWIIALRLDHIEPLLPYVSDLGVTAPEASLFSLFLNLGAILITLFTIIRYETTKAFILLNDKSVGVETLRALNRRSLASGIAMAIGFVFVANFRNAEGVLVQCIHNVSAVFGFASTVVDMWLQSKIASAMTMHSTGRFRCILAASALFLAISYNILSIVSLCFYPDALFDKELRLKWNSTNRGYSLHVMSTALEWVLIFLISPYFYSFVKQFKSYSLRDCLLNYNDIKGRNNNVIELNKA